MTDRPTTWTSTAADDDDLTQIINYDSADDQVCFEIEINFEES